VIVSVWCELYCCLGVKLCWWQWRIVAESDELAQASLPRLGEIYRDSPKSFFTKGRPGDPLYFFGWANVSLRRGGSRLSDHARRVLMLEVELSPRRRELAWARVLLAWARPLCLSEMLGEKGVSLDVFLISKVDNMLVWVLPLSLWTEWLVWMRWCMSCDLWVLTWCEHDNCMRWFMKLKWWVWYEFDMRHERVGIYVAW